TVTRSSPEYTDGDRLEGFDAESWAFVQYLMFGDEGAHRKQLDQFAALVHQGMDPAIALKETFGRIQEFETPFNAHISKSLFPYAKASVDVSVKREAFDMRPLAPGESAAARAAFHVAMGRPVEARMLIEQDRKADSNEAARYVSEGLLLDRDNKTDDA